MKNPTSSVVHPETFETIFRSDGYWIVMNYDDTAIGVMYGAVTTNPPTGYSEDSYRIDYDPSTGIFAIVVWKTTHFLKPVTQAEFETAKAFGFGTEYDSKSLPDLIPKFPDEIMLDKDGLI